MLILNYLNVFLQLLLKCVVSWWLSKSENHDLLAIWFCFLFLLAFFLQSFFLTAPFVHLIHQFIFYFLFLLLLPFNFLSISHHLVFGRISSIPCCSWPLFITTFCLITQKQLIDFSDIISATFPYLSVFFNVQNNRPKRLIILRIGARTAMLRLQDGSDRRMNLRF